MAVPSMEQRSTMCDAPTEDEAPLIRGLFAEFSMITPAGHDLEDLAIMFRLEYPVIDRIRRAFAFITLAERLVLARFVLHYADPALALNDRAAEAVEELIEEALEQLTMLGLAEQVVSAHRVFILAGSPTAVEALSEAMSKGQPPALGLWLSYVVLRDLMRPLGDDLRTLNKDHGLIKLARAIVDSRNPPAER